jgi:AcrR family transcriptional regulator
LKGQTTIGRPREFDTAKAVDQALNLFWRKGYEGTTLMDLIESIGVLKPSLYAAFGSKEELFLKALDRYKERLGAAVSPAFTLPSARASLEQYLRGLASFQSAAGTPQGCLLVQGALVGSEASNRVSKTLCESREQGFEIIRSLLARAVKQQELPKNTDIDQLAMFFNAVSHGISVQAVSGIPAEQLHNTISIAMRSWPESRTANAAKKVARRRIGIRKPTKGKK